MPTMYGLEYTRVMCETCMRDCNADDQTMTKLDGGWQCEECREFCGGNCGEYLTDKTVAIAGPVVHFRDYVYDGKLVAAHASCAADTFLTYLDPDYSYDHTTKGEIAVLIAPHFAQARVLVHWPEAVCIQRNGWFYVCKRMGLDILKSNVIAYGRTEKEAWFDAGLELKVVAA